MARFLCGVVYCFVFVLFALPATVRNTPQGEAGLTAQWPEADFPRAGVDLSEIRSGGPWRDVAHNVIFAFAFHAFWPDGEWRMN